MADIDDELIARAIRWCAEAGRHATAAQVRAALDPLSWDELLAARALLADPPPARPLGPSALADMARGALPDVAAERERDGRYGTGEAVEDIAERPAAPEPSPRSTRARRARRAAGPVIRRARDRAEPSAATARKPPLVDELFASEGRAVLQRLIRAHGARRAPIVAALAAGWRRGDDTQPGDQDLTALLDAHGLTRAFEARERDEMLHALRAAGGVLGRGAALLSLSPEAFRARIERLGAAREMEAIRRAHQDELRHQATLSERVRLVLADTERLADLGLLEEFEADLRTRIPEHVRAVRSSGATPLFPALARSLGIAPRDVARLAARLGVDVDRPAPAMRHEPGAAPKPRRPSTAGARPGTTRQATGTSRRTNQHRRGGRGQPSRGPRRR